MKFDRRSRNFYPDDPQSFHPLESTSRRLTFTITTPMNAVTEVADPATLMILTTKREVHQDQVYSAPISRFTSENKSILFFVFGYSLSSITKFQILNYLKLKNIFLDLKKKKKKKCLCRSENICSSSVAELRIGGSTVHRHAG